MTYHFDVMLCGGYAGGQIEIVAYNYDEAYEEAMDLVAKRLVEAFPELDIEYSVECTDDEEE